MVLGAVGQRCCRFFFSEYFKKLVIFQWDWIFVGLGGFLDFVDYSLTYFPWVCFADLPIFGCFSVVLLYVLFFRDCVSFSELCKHFSVQWSEWNFTV